MSKIAVVYWSGTGNTERMAEAVTEGAKEAGAEHFFSLLKHSVQRKWMNLTQWPSDARPWEMRSLRIQNLNLYLRTVNQS